MAITISREDYDQLWQAQNPTLDLSKSLINTAFSPIIKYGLNLLALMGNGMGCANQFTKGLYQEKLAQTRTKLAPVINTYPRILPIDFNGSTFYVYSYSSSIAALLEELGFQLVLLEGLPRETAHSPEAPQISIEALVRLDPDIILVVAWDKSNLYDPEPAAKRQWEEIPLLQNMQAVKEGRIRFVSGQLWGGTRDGPIAYNLMFEQLPDLLLPFVEEK